jgi:hypothetical protein
VAILIYIHGQKTCSRHKISIYSRRWLDGADYMRYRKIGLLMLILDELNTYDLDNKIDISSAGDGIRTHEHLRDWTLNPAPLTWLGNPRKKGSLSLALVVYNSIRRLFDSSLQPTLISLISGDLFALERNLSPLQLREKLLHENPAA